MTDDQFRRPPDLHADRDCAAGYFARGPDIGDGCGDYVGRGLNRNFLRRSPSATEIRNVRSGGA